MKNWGHPVKCKHIIYYIYRGETRGAMTTDMLKSIEREVEKLKIQSENLKMRRSFAKGESDEQEYMAREATIRQEVGEKATHLIHAGQERIQVMQHIPSHVGIEHLNYDQLTTLRVFNIYIYSVYI